MRTRFIGIFCLFVLSTLVAGCGDTGSTTSKPKVVASMKGVSLAGPQILCGFQFTIELPAGVYLNTASATPIKLLNASDGHVEYKSTTLQTLKTTVDVAVVTPSGFGPNQSLEIDCAISPGYFPQAAEFLMYPNFFAKDQNGAPINISAPVMTIDATSWY